MPELPPDDRYYEYRNPDIRCHETRGVPVTLEEDGKSADQSDDDRADESIPGSEGLERSFPG